MAGKIEAYYRAIVDCWRLFKRYRMSRTSEGYWQELHDEAHRIYQRNKKTAFVKQILFVMLDEIEENAKGDSHGTKK